MKSVALTSLDRPTPVSPNVYARIGGILYFIMIVLGIIQQMIRGKIVVEADAMATGDNLRKFEMLWRWGIAFELVMMIFTTIICWIIYLLTKPVNRNIALLAAFFYMLAISTQTVYCLELIKSLVPVSGMSYLDTFTPGQLSAMSNSLIKTHGSGFGITLLLCGPYFLLTGYLLFRSGYFPKIMGLIYLVPGICYMVSSFLLILAPAFGEKNYFFFAAPAGFAELILALWLIIKGVRIEKWNRIRATTSPL